MIRSLLTALALLPLAACDSADGGEETMDAAAIVDDGGIGPRLDRGVTPDGEVPLSLEAVSGDFTYAQLGAEGGHIYSQQIDGLLRQRITTNQAFWGHHAVGPDPRFVAAVRHRDGDGDGRDDPDGPGEIWILDVKERTGFPMSPAECDAGIGGVGWRDEVRLLFAMDCGDAPAAVYLGSTEDRSRARANLLQLSDHDVPVRDVFPAVATPLYTYVVDNQICSAGGTCVTKPQVWLADADTGRRCRVTDGDQRNTDPSTITGPQRRLGDHSPSFNGDLSSVVFSRNVGGKGRGPEGHHDLMRVGLNRQALFRGEETCAQGGTEVNLSEDLFDDRYPGPDGPVVGNERSPHGPAGRAPVGTVIFTGEVVQGDAVVQSAAYIVAPDGTRTPLTPESGRAAYARWIVIDYMLDGER